MIDSMIRLRYDPYRCFTASVSPVGLYARQKWIGMENDEGWQTDFDNCAASLGHGQGQDGSWDGLFLRTVHRLFGLHLTVRNPTREIEKALDWLLHQTVSGQGDAAPIVTPGNLQGLPFVPGHPRALPLAMTLFLSSIFGRADHPEIVAQYREVSRRVLQDSGSQHEADMSNALRALVVHPAFSGDPATLSIVENLSRLQQNSGGWPDPFPLFLTVNALAHLDHSTADRQLERAFTLLSRTQNEDGTWGTAEREWNTFLVVHAMRNKKIIT
jgi:hypothetical protein